MFVEVMVDMREASPESRDDGVNTSSRSPERFSRWGYNTLVKRGLMLYNTRDDMERMELTIAEAQHQAYEGLFTCGDNGIDVGDGEATYFVDIEFIIFQVQPTKSPRWDIRVFY